MWRGRGEKPRMDIEPLVRPQWEPLPYEGCQGVEGKVLLIQEGLALALLRFSDQATIHEHAAPFPVDVVCLEGRGRVSLGREDAAIEAGQRVLWPADVPHRLWTEDATMMTLMVEHPPVP